MMWNSWGGWMHADWLVGVAVWMVVMLGAVLAAAIWGARRSLGRRASDGAEFRETPLEILQKRYARGDISKEDFEQRRRDLG